MKICDTYSASETENNDFAGPGIPSKQIEDDSPIVSFGDDHPIKTTSSGNSDVTLNHKNT